MSEPAIVSTIITDRGDSPPNNSLIVTDAGQPDIVLKVMSPLAQTLVRGLRTYIQSLVGMLTLLLAGRPVLENVGIIVPAGDFWSALVAAASIAIAPTVVSLLQNFAELLGRFDELFPKSRA